MNKKQTKKETAITVEKAWFEGLLKYAADMDDEVMKLSKDERMLLLAINLHSLLGYISSAKQILMSYQKPIKK